MDYLDGKPNATAAKTNTTGDVTASPLTTCDCEYKVYSISGSPSLGNHLEMLALTPLDFCSSPSCPFEFGYYGCGYDDLWGTDACSTNLDRGLSTFPTQWIPFNCSVTAGQTFLDRLYLTEWNSSCVSPDLVPGTIVYGIRCKGSCTADWEYSASTQFTFSGSGSTYINFDVNLLEGAGCDCLPDIDY